MNGKRSAYKNYVPSEKEKEEFNNLRHKITKAKELFHIEEIDVNEPTIELESQILIVEPWFHNSPSSSRVILSEFTYFPQIKQEMLLEIHKLEKDYLYRHRTLEKPNYQPNLNVLLVEKLADQFSITTSNSAIAEIYSKNHRISDFYTQCKLSGVSKDEANSIVRYIHGMQAYIRSSRDIMQELNFQKTELEKKYVSELRTMNKEFKDRISSENEQLVFEFNRQLKHIKLAEEYSSKINQQSKELRRLNERLDIEKKRVLKIQETHNQNIEQLRQMAGTYREEKENQRIKEEERKREETEQEMILKQELYKYNQIRTDYRKELFFISEHEKEMIKKQHQEEMEKKEKRLDALRSQVRPDVER
jgi:hypothetical protein